MAQCHQKHEKFAETMNKLTRLFSKKKNVGHRLGSGSKTTELLADADGSRSDGEGKDTHQQHRHSLATTASGTVVDSTHQQSKHSSSSSGESPSAGTGDRRALALAAAERRQIAGAMRGGLSPAHQIHNHKKQPIGFVSAQQQNDQFRRMLD
eukprot:Lankesteria_metandrocarpae@DN3362_c0_g1_i1.p1